MAVGSVVMSMIDNFTGIPLLDVVEVQAWIVTNGGNAWATMGVYNDINVPEELKIEKSSNDLLFSDFDGGFFELENDIPTNMTVEKIRIVDMSGNIYFPETSITPVVLAPGEILRITEMKLTLA